MVADVRDVDAQYLISVGDLLCSAALAKLEVEVLTDAGCLVVGRPEDLGARGAANMDVDLRTFRIGDVLVRLDEIVRCTVHARGQGSRRLDHDIELARSPAAHSCPSPSATRPAAAAATGGSPRRSSGGQACANLRLTLLADDLGAGRAYRIAAGFLGGIADAGITSERALPIVYELVSNVVLHAYDADRSTFVLDLSIADSELSILVSDDGRGPCEPSPRPGAGRGWRLVAKLSHEFTITHRGQGGTLIDARLKLR